MRFAAYGFLAEVKIAIKSESKFRDHPHTMASDIVTKVEVEAMKGFQDNASLKHLFFIAVGAEFYQVDDIGEHIRVNVETDQNMDYFRKITLKYQLYRNRRNSRKHKFIVIKLTCSEISPIFQVYPGA